MSQDNTDPKVVQFSGLIYFLDEQGNPHPVPLVHLLVKGKNRGNYANQDGFFSMAVLEGDIIELSSIGFKTIELIVPDNISTNIYSIKQEMDLETYILPELTIRNWPSRENFKIEFLNINTTKPFVKYAYDNLSPDRLAEVEAVLPHEGREIAKIHLKNIQTNLIYTNQIKPQPILSPLAWSKFIQELKAGRVFKKKD